MIRPLTTFLFLLIVTITATAGDPRSGAVSSTYNSLYPVSRKTFDANRLTFAIGDDGIIGDYRAGGYYGHWPRALETNVLYTSGIWIIGVHRPTGLLRSAMHNYQSDFQRGPIISLYRTDRADSAAVADPADAAYRLFSISRNELGSGGADIAQWPGHLGAPYIDVDANGTWDPGIDTPRMHGDQMLWSVTNDNNMAARIFYKISNPMGLEVQTLYFGYDREGPLGDVLFIEWTIINKSDADYDSVMVGIYNDIDLGDAFDDVIGSDPIRSLTYIYNGDNNDDGGGSGFRRRPAACGFALLPPPGTTTTEKGGAFALVPIIKSGTQSLPVIPNGLGEELQRQSYRVLHGLLNTGLPVINPHTGAPSRMIFDGDPVAGTGWLYLDSYRSPYDSRSIVSAPPFTLAKGDTQVVRGLFAIGQSTDRLTAISALRRTVDVARLHHSEDFVRLPLTRTIVHDPQHPRTVTVQLSLPNGPSRSATVEARTLFGDSLTLTCAMEDDGTRYDTLAADGLRSATFDLPWSPVPQYLRFTAVDADGRTLSWDHMTKPITTSLLRADTAIVVRDGLTNDQVADIGGFAHLRLSISNPDPTGDSVIMVRPSTSLRHLISFYHLRPYLAPFGVDIDTFSFDIAVPRDITGPHWQLPVETMDAQGNHSTLRFRIPVELPYFATTNRVQGHGKIDFEVIIADRAAVKDHQYVITGRRNASSVTTIVLRDSTAGTLLTDALPLDSTSYGFMSRPVTDGFKVRVHRSVSTPSVQFVHRANGPAWQALQTVALASNGSTVHYGDISSVRIAFARPTGFEDGNGNGTHDSGEPYRFDTTDTHRAQRAYFLTKVGTRYRSLGHHFVPFTVTDIDADPPVPLAVAVVRSDSSAQFDGTPSVLDTYVLSLPYDPSDGLFGDTTLTPLLNANRPIPYHYRLTIGTNAGMTFLADSSETDIVYSHPFSSHDMFLFNPTHLTAVRSVEPAPDGFSFSQNFPNPFNPSTTLRYSLPNDLHVVISVYNSIGQRIVTLQNGTLRAGVHTVLWNGSDDRGQRVASGLYFCHITAGSFRSTRKMLFLK